MTARTAESAMPLPDALRVLWDARREQIVIPTMGAAREWMKLGTHDLDFIYAPSSMGQAPSLGMGLALAQPARQVVVLNGDGCTLMNLGCLVSITAAAPTNYVLVVCDNGVYEVTGMQPTPGDARVRRGPRSINYAELARAADFQSVYEFSDVAAWRIGINEVLQTPGPTFVVLKVAAMPGAIVPRSPAPARERARQFAKRLAQE